MGASTGIGAPRPRCTRTLGPRSSCRRGSRPLLEAFVREHPGSEAVALDVPTSALKAAVLQLRARPRLDLIVYAAGTYRPMSAWPLTARWPSSTSTSVWVGANLLDAVLPWLLASCGGPGRPPQPLISSIAASRGLPSRPGLWAQKAALIAPGRGAVPRPAPWASASASSTPASSTTPLTAQNDFKMPAEISAETAADACSTAARGRDLTSFPLPRRFCLRPFEAACAG